MAFFNPQRPSYLDDPYPALARLREQEPVHFSPQLNAWLITSYEHCVLVLHDHERFASDFRRVEAVLAGGASAEPGAEVPTHLVASDPPQHTRLRTLVARAFARNAVEGLRPFVERAVEGLLDGVEPGDPFDVMSQLAGPLPSLVVAEQLGVPEEEREVLREQVKAVVAAELPSASEQLRAAGESARERLAGRLDRYAAQGGGAIAQMATAGDEPLTRHELFSVTVDLASAGIDSTSYLIANGLLALLEHPEQLALLRERPELTAGAVDELCRFDSPTQALPRIAAAETRLGGKRIRAGDALYVMVGAANRDPEQFPDPDRLDIEREDRRHLSFALGAHFCVGAPLARLIGEVVLRALLDRFDRLSLVADGATRRANFQLRGLSELSVVAG